jgi:hypothetical protein
MLPLERLDKLPAILSENRRGQVGGLEHAGNWLELTFTR